MTNQGTIYDWNRCLRNPLLLLTGWPFQEQSSDSNTLLMNRNAGARWGRRVLHIPCKFDTMMKNGPPFPWTPISNAQEQFKFDQRPRSHVQAPLLLVVISQDQVTGTEGAGDKWNPLQIWMNESGIIVLLCEKWSNAELGNLSSGLGKHVATMGQKRNKSKRCVWRGSSYTEHTSIFGRWSFVAPYTKEEGNSCITWTRKISHLW